MRRRDEIENERRKKVGRNEREERGRGERKIMWRVEGRDRKEEGDRAKG